MKRVNSIAQAGDTPPTKENPNGVIGPVHIWDNSHNRDAAHTGYSADGAAVYNIQWLDFQVDGTQVTPSNFASAGYFPFDNKSNFQFNEQAQFWQELFNIMTVQLVK